MIVNLNLESLDQVILFTKILASTTIALNFEQEKRYILLPTKLHIFQSKYLQDVKFLKDKA